ncbi:hypothetical protein ACP70R_010126 [Stipagrostis hirtigluma subsp. patula]
MGCKGSKLDDQEAVALCRGRAVLLAAAVRHRYALAGAHAALADSLESTAAPLHRVLQLLLAESPRLALPSERKGGENRLPRPFDAPSPPRGSRSSHHQLGSCSGSESGSPACSPPRRVPDQLPHPHYAYGAYGYGCALPQPAFAYPAPAPAGSLQFYYARSRPPPASVAVAQRAPPQERVYFGSFDVPGGYPQYAYGAPPAAPAPQRVAAAAPPSPPKASTWDFLNVFESYEPYENYYYESTAAAAAADTLSRSSREVREEEGIPELEDDEDDGVVVKEVSREHSAAGTGGARSRRSSLGGLSSGARSRRSSVGGVSDVAELEEPDDVVVQSDIMAQARQSTPAHRNVAMPAAAPPAQRVVGNADVAGEIMAQLVHTAEAARQLSPLLEVGRPSYQGRSSAYHSSSRTMSAISMSHLGCKDMDVLDVGSVGKLDSWSIASTLEKLYFWERKLYGEVKAEEKMRLLLAKYSKRLKLLDQRGAEAHKIDATRSLLRKLSTKIRIAVRVIAKVSRKINKVRDEELMPQLNALIQGFVSMWHDKLDSYRTQCQVISEVKDLTSVVSGGNGRDLAMELELELIKWIISFSSWVNAQRNFVKALNGWLALCLNHEPEDTAIGEPYSPGRIGAPLVFVTCNKWSQAMDRISEKDVVNAMQALVSSVRHLWEQQHLEQSEQTMVIREREKWTRILERKTQELNKEADELNKKLAQVPNRHSLHIPRTVQMYEAHCVEASNLHINLRLVLQALENFAANSLEAFQEIVRYAEGARLPRENVRVRKQ